MLRYTPAAALCTVHYRTLAALLKDLCGIAKILTMKCTTYGSLYNIVGDGHIKAPVIDDVDVASVKHGS